MDKSHAEENRQQFPLIVKPEGIQGSEKTKENLNDKMNPENLKINK